MDNATKENIANIFIELTNEKDVSKIGITDICEKFGIARQTFYYHFKSIDDLIEWTILNDTKKKTLEFSKFKTWNDASMDYICIFNRYMPMIKGLLNSKKAVFILHLIGESIETYMRSYINSKNSNACFTQFLYNTFRFSVTGMIVQEMQKDDFDLRRIITDVNDNLKLTKTYSSNK